MSRMPRLVEIEQRLGRLGQVLEAFRATLNPEALKEAKERLDLYYVHHEAASVALAAGRWEEFDRHVEIARAELGAAEAVIRKALGI